MINMTQNWQLEKKFWNKEILNLVSASPSYLVALFLFSAVLILFQFIPLNSVKKCGVKKIRPQVFGPGRPICYEILEGCVSC